MLGAIGKFISGPVFGGLLNLGGKVADYKLARQGQKMAQAQFDQQMDHSVRRRVEDAKRAGVHPLFALGASSGGSPTLAAGGGSPSGSAVGEALQSVIKAASAKDESEAALNNAKTKVIEKSLDSRGRDAEALELFGEPPPGTIYGDPAQGHHVVRPPEVPATRPDDPSHAAGDRPFWTTIQGPNGPVKVPDPETFDDLSMPALMFMLADHVKHGQKRLWAGLRIKLGPISDYHIAQMERDWRRLRELRLAVQRGELESVPELKTRAKSYWRKIIEIMRGQ